MPFGAARTFRVTRAVEGRREQGIEFGEGLVLGDGALADFAED